MSHMKMTNAEYNSYVNKKSPKSKYFVNILMAYLVGGLICCVGQGLIFLYRHYGIEAKDAMTWASVTLVFAGALITGFGWYDNLAKIGRAGTLVPITGFANAVVSPALEFRSEGLVLGMSSKMFVIAGPVIVFGTIASVVYGLVLLIFM